MITTETIDIKEIFASSNKSRQNDLKIVNLTEINESEGTHNKINSLLPSLPILPFENVPPTEENRILGKGIPKKEITSNTNVTKVEVTPLISEESFNNTISNSTIFNSTVSVESEITEESNSTSSETVTADISHPIDFLAECINGTSNVNFTCFNKWTNETKSNYTLVAGAVASNGVPVLRAVDSAAIAAGVCLVTAVMGYFTCVGYRRYLQ